MLESVNFLDGNSAFGIIKLVSPGRHSGANEPAFAVAACICASSYFCYPAPAARVSKPARVLISQ